MSERESVRQRAFGAVLQRAVFSWQIALTAIVTLLLVVLQPAPVAFWQWWFWLIGGGITAGLFVVSNLTDPQAAQEAISKEFERQYNLAQIKSTVSRQHLQSAMEYRRSMRELSKHAKGALRVELLQTIDAIDNQISGMYDLALKIDAFQSNELAERDRKRVGDQLDNTRIRMEREQDSEVRRDLERLAHQLEQQLVNLESVANGMKRAEIQLETTLATLATVYAQMANLGTKEVDSGKSQRLRQEIQSEVLNLQDTIDAMSEVQQQTLRSS
jgi:hypothetical protein